jgi:protein subunit release factor B
VDARTWGGLSTYGGAGITVNREVTPSTKVRSSVSGTLRLVVKPNNPTSKLRTLKFNRSDLNSSVLSSSPDSSNRMRSLGLCPDEFEEVFSRSSGPGGQHVNKVSTAVTLVHRPSGVSVTVQETRSQYRNRRLAINRLISLIEEKRKQQIGERRAATERERRRNSRRPRALRREIRKSKERRAEIKQTRAKISPY